jgi:uncharacterized protein (UPF0335 family)
MAYPSNSVDGDDTEDAADLISADDLIRHVERIKKLEAERKQAAERVTDARKDAAETGIDTQALAFILRLSRMDVDDREVYLYRIRKYAALVRYL